MGVLKLPSRWINYFSWASASRWAIPHVFTDDILLFPTTRTIEWWVIDESSYTKGAAIASQDRLVAAFIVILIHRRAVDFRVWSSFNRICTRSASVALTEWAVAVLWVYVDHRVIFVLRLNMEHNLRLLFFRRKLYILGVTFCDSRVEATYVHDRTLRLLGSQVARIGCQIFTTHPSDWVQLLNWGMAASILLCCVHIRTLLIEHIFPWSLSSLEFKLLLRLRQSSLGRVIFASHEWDWLFGLASRGSYRNNFLFFNGTVIATCTQYTFLNIELRYDGR